MRVVAYTCRVVRKEKKLDLYNNHREFRDLKPVQFNLLVGRGHCCTTNASKTTMRQVVTFNSFFSINAEGTNEKNRETQEESEGELKM